MSTITASVRQAAARETAEFDWLLGQRPMLTFKFLAGQLNLSDSFLEKLWDDKGSALHISGHEFNGGAGKRNTKRIARPFAVRLLVKSSRYTGAEKVTSITSCAADFNAADCEAIAAAFLAEARRKKGL